jgi:ABC-type nitrate/sulfonate/bicarbonate transport system ATPase subunit
MISVQNLDFDYTADSKLFTGFNWHVLEGEAWTIVGPSGCGKTTLLYLLAGLLHPVQGRIHIHGEALLRPRPRTGLILQDYGLLPWATVRQNVALGLRIRSFYGPDGLHAPPETETKQPEEDVEYWLERLKLLPVAENYPTQISGGQRQRTAIARTLVLDPDLLLMDEPFASLDAPTREALQDLILELHLEKKITVIAVTHTIEEAALLGDHILILGHTPNERGQTIENPGGAQIGFRGTEAYGKVCSLLRNIMEAQG